MKRAQLSRFFIKGSHKDSPTEKRKTSSTSCFLFSIFFFIFVQLPQRGGIFSIVAGATADGTRTGLGHLREQYLMAPGLWHHWSEMGSLL